MGEEHERRVAAGELAEHRLTAGLVAADQGFQQAVLDPRPGDAGAFDGQHLVGRVVAQAGVEIVQQAFEQLPVVRRAPAGFVDLSH